MTEAICPVCERAAIDGATHPRCMSRFAIDGLTSFFRYDGAIRKAVKALKYRLVSDLAAEFVSLISEDLFSKLYTLNPKPFCFIPIPLHPSRFRERGFNQTEVLGKLIAAKLHASLQKDILRRVRRTTAQVEMKRREDRLQNMKNVFSVSAIKYRNNEALFLFDDVFTTGATMRSAANVLKRSGVKFVWGITMAR